MFYKMTIVWSQLFVSSDYTSGIVYHFGANFKQTNKKYVAD